MLPLLASHAASFASALGSALEPTFWQSFWSAALFEKRQWEQTMNVLRIVLTLGGALLLLFEMRAMRMGEWLSERLRRRLAIGLSVLAFGAYFDFGNPNVRYDEYIHRHEFFHYYLGSKYSQELGYKRIYECTAAAEMELGRAAAVKNRELRDLRVNLIKKNSDPEVAANIEECRQIFQQNPERWAAFKKDIDWFYKSSAGSYWENMQKDHGYNPPPVWTLTGKIFSSLGSADLVFFQWLSMIDVAFHIGIVLMLFWAFGWRVGAIATIWWGCNYPANFYWTGGAFLRQDWFFFLTAAVCLARKRKFELAGAALVWSSLLRVFPMLFFAGVGIIIAFQTVQRWRRWNAPEAPAGQGDEDGDEGEGGARPAAKGKGKPPERRQPSLLDYLHPDHRRFLGGAIVAGGVLVTGSVVATGGFDSYKEFAGHTLGTHNTTPLTNHMGLKTLMVHDWEGRMRFTRDNNLDDPFKEWKAGRKERAHETRHVRHAIVVGLLVWAAWALRRTKLLWVGMALSAPFAMSVVELTCYYYTMFITVCAIALVRPGFGPIILLSSAASQLLGSNVHNTYYFIDDKFAAQSWLFFVYGLLLLYSYSRPFSLERLQAWWRGDPEPLTAPPKPHALAFED